MFWITGAVPMFIQLMNALRHALIESDLAGDFRTSFAACSDDFCVVFVLLQPHFNCEYDDTQSIGRRYRRQDEIGTPYCVTVDFDTLEDKAVTIRERDSTEQVRVPVDRLVDELRAKLTV